MENIEDLIAIVFALSIPIVAIVMTFITEMKKKRHETELRLALIQNGTDAETAKILIEQKNKKNDRFGALRWGCILIGVGLGALCDALLCIEAKHNIYFWLIIAAGMGIGLLVSFIIEYKLSKKEQLEKKQDEIPAE